MCIPSVKKQNLHLEMTSLAQRFRYALLILDLVILLATWSPYKQSPTVSFGGFKKGAQQFGPTIEAEGDLKALTKIVERMENCLAFAFLKSNACYQ